MALPARTLPLLAVLCLAPGCSSEPSLEGIQERTSGDSVAVEVNSVAPAFAGRTLAGDTVRLADLVGSHVVLLEFWSIFCKSCLEEMPHIERLYERYRGDGLAVVSVNTDVFSAARVSSFLEKTGIRPPYPVVRDARQEIAQAYRVELLPVTVIVDRRGWIRLYQEGYRPGDEERFEDRVRSLLGKKPAEDVTLAAREGVTAFAPSGSALAAVGQQPGPLRAAGLEGEAVTLSGGKPCLLFFWSLYCQPCRGEYPAMARLRETYASKGLQAYAVNVDAAQLLPRVRRFAAGHASLPCVLDESSGGPGAVASALGVRATPTVVLLDREGKVAYAEAGSADLAALEERVRAVVGGD